MSPRAKRYFAFAAATFILLAAVVFARRWVHHAQLELIPVLIAPGTDAAAIVHPPPAAVARRMVRDISEMFSPPQRPRLAVLTFDDGPYPVESPALALELARLRVPADFFLIGADAERQPAITQRLRGWGFSIDNHTLTHPEMPNLAYARQVEEIGGGKAALTRVTGSATPFFRPPHGNYDAATIEAAWANGQMVALWDVNPGDWQTRTADEIVESVRLQARAPAVILLHAGKEPTIAAIPAIVQLYRSNGYEFVSLGELQRRLPLDAINDPIKVSM